MNWTTDNGETVDSWSIDAEPRVNLVMTGNATPGVTKLIIPPGSNPIVGQITGLPPCPGEYLIVNCALFGGWDITGTPGLVFMQGLYIDIIDTALAKSSITGDTTIKLAADPFTIGDLLYLQFTSTPTTNITFAPPPNGLNNLDDGAPVCGQISNQV